MKGKNVHVADRTLLLLDSLPCYTHVEMTPQVLVWGIGSTLLEFIRLGWT